MSRFNSVVLGVIVVWCFSASPAVATPINLAQGASTAGTDPGWGGGSQPWEMVDGARTYTEWWHGWAQQWNGGTGPGTTSWSNQAVIDWGTPQWFDEMQLWHHSYVPVTNTIFDYWDGGAWVNIAYTRSYTGVDAGGAGSLQDIYDFNPVYGSKVRWTIPAGTQFCNGCATHAWLYEFEVYQADAVPEPASLVLVGTGFTFAASQLRRRRNRR